MHLSVARLCLDCHEVHADDRCPACTSEAFAFITRWISLEGAAIRKPFEPSHPAASKVETYRQLLEPAKSRSRARKWLRNGGLLVAAGVVARWGWRIVNRESESPDGRRKT